MVSLFDPQEDFNTDRPLSDPHATVRPWRVLVAGAGAIGCTVSARLACAGHHVTMLARGPTLETLGRQGLLLDDLNGTWQTPVSAVGDVSRCDPPDLLLLCSKSQDLPDLARQIHPVIGQETLILPLVNGVPFWYFQRAGGRFDDRPVHSVDPTGHLLAALPIDQVLGAVVFITAQVIAAGHVRAQSPHVLMLGELAGGQSMRLQKLCAMLTAAGIEARPQAQVRDVLWTKLIANLTSNPLSVITGATLQMIYSDPVLVETVQDVMFEAMLVASAHGARLEIDPIELLRRGTALGDVRTSMLKDFEQGRPLELAAIGDAVLELADLYALPMRATRRLLANARWHAQHRAVRPAHPQSDKHHEPADISSPSDERR